MIVNYLQKVAVVCIWQRKWFTYVNWDKIKNCSLSFTNLMLSLVSELSQSTYFTYVVFLLDNENWLAQCHDLMKITQFGWIKMNKASVSEFIHLDLIISWISTVTIVLVCWVVILHIRHEKFLITVDILNWQVWICEFSDLTRICSLMFTSLIHSQKCKLIKSLCNVLNYIDIIFLRCLKHKLVIFIVHV